MNREELTYLIPYILSLALSLGILIYAWRRQTVAGARPFAWLACTQAVWTFGFILELITPTLSGKLFWDAFQWVGGIVMPLIFPAFAIEYANFQIKRPRLVWGSLAAFPLILLILVLTSGYHKLLYPNPHLVSGEPFSSLDYDFTALFWAASLYVYAIIIGCMIVLIQKFGRSFPLYRSQVFIIAVGAAFPILVTFLPLIGINIAPQRDPTPFTFAIGNLIIGVGLFHYRLLDLVPIARERVLEDMTDAIIVLDASNRIVDMNHAALANVGKTSPEVIGRPAQEVFAEWPELREQTQNLGNAVLEVSATVKGEHRLYDLSVSSIRDQMNRLIGWVFVAHDITARKMLEERYRLLSEELEERVLERTEDLRESEFRLQAAIDAAHIGLWDWELTSGKVTSLGHHDKIFGFAPGEFGGTYSDFEKCVHPEDAEELNRLIQLAREAGSEYAHEYRVVWPDGTIHWIAGRGKFEYNASGKPVRMRGAVLDISERRQAEEALRQSESNFRTLAEKSLEGIQLYQGGRSVYANAAMTALFGYTQEELGAMSMEEHIALVHPLDRAIVLERARRRQSGQEVPASLEVRILTKTGAPRWVQGFTNEIEYNGQPAILSTAIDITERKRSEQALQESEERYHTLVDQIPAIVYIDDASKNPGITMFVNSYIKTALGFTPEEWIDGGYDLWRSCIHPEDRVQVLSEYQRCIQSGQPFDREYRVIARDGRLVWLHEHSSLWTDEEGHPFSMHGIAHDITERKQAEEEIRRHAARMEALAEISNALAEVGLDVQAVFDTIVRHTAELIGDTCSIRLLSSDEQWLESVAFHNPNPEVKALMRLLHPIIPTSADHSWLTPVLRTGQPLLIPIITQEQLRRSVQPEYLPFFEQVGLHSLLIVPLRVKGRVIGTLGLSRDQPGHPYTPDDEVLLQDLADRASLTIQNAQLFKQVQGSHQRLQVLSSRLVEVQESERKNLAREIHDELGQSLTALKIDLAWLNDHLPPRSKSLREKVDSALDLTNETIQMTQRLASQLRPRMLDDLGLAAALEWHVNEWSKHTRIKAKITLPEEEWQLNPSLDTALYRVCQETLTNVARHAGASKVEVSLAREGDEVVLTVRDNGRGMDGEKISAPESLGLLGMKERVEQIGGRLEVQSEVGKVTVVVARVPILQLPSYQLSYPAPKEHVQAKKSPKGKESRRRKS